MNLIFMLPLLCNILHNAENHFIFFIIRHYAIQITFLILQINLILHQIPFKSQYTRQTVIIHDLRYRFPDQAPLFRHIEQFGRRLIHLNDLQIIIHSYQKSGHGIKDFIGVTFLFCPHIWNAHGNLSFILDNGNCLFPACVVPAGTAV